MPHRNSQSRQPQIDAVRDGDPLPPEDRPQQPAPRLLEALYQSQAPRLRRFFARRSCGSDCEDLTHETFVRFASRAARSGEQVDDTEAYLSRVAVNLLRDRAKFAVRRAAVHHQDLDQSASARDPLEHLESRDFLRRLDVALRKLRPRTREVFLLQRREGMTYAEIANRTGLSTKAVKKHMAKALFALRRDIGPI